MKAQLMSVRSISPPKQKSKKSGQGDIVDATAAIQRIGRDKIMFWNDSLYCYRQFGVWQRVQDREIRQGVQSILGNRASKSRVDSVLDLLKTEIYQPHHQFNFNDNVVNTLSGELHFNGISWALERHKPEHFLLTQIPVSYDPEASCPRFRQFLGEVFSGDEDAEQKAVIIFEMLGYTLVPSSRFEKFIMLVGDGGNGKSVLLHVIEALCGKTNVCAVHPSQFTNKHQRAHLLGKLANVVTEIAEGSDMPDAELKTITSGELMTVEEKFKRPFEFHPFCTLWLGTNHLPHTRDFSDALFRRAILIQFNNRFDGARRDVNLKDKLRAELPGILNLALEAFSAVLTRGYFTECLSGTLLKTEWQKENDQIAQFLQDEAEHDNVGCLVYDTEQSASVFSRYKQWASDAGIRHQLSRPVLTKRLRRFGVMPDKGTGGMRVLKGISLKSTL